jgi:predicted nucleic acid-binding protein
VIVFVDTSALFALLDRADSNHNPAAVAWKSLIERQANLVCTNYVLVEAFALIRHRLGMQAVRTLQDDIVPMLDVKWLAQEDHQAGVAAFLTAANRQLSLVDCTSFETMRSMGIQAAFAYDRHFAEQGFALVSSNRQETSDTHTYHAQITLQA